MVIMVSSLFFQPLILLQLLLLSSALFFSVRAVGAADEGSDEEKLEFGAKINPEEESEVSEEDEPRDGKSLRNTFPFNAGGGHDEHHHHHHHEQHNTIEDTR